ncbi:MAG TPA: cyclic pyranopterin monophosphate synthase MoaC [Nitrososphaerales archaeon]|nr:cyclic pyranopterin monophosphate synthase MoaC [Nitrososphaerales archaeon]
MPFQQVDVSAKPLSNRTASATGRIKLKRETIALIRKGGAEKGDPVSLASFTGVMAAKKTPEIVVLCHQLQLQSTKVDVELEAEAVRVSATVTAQEKTGVEMEALTAVAVALLNVWDIVKQYEKDADGQYPTTRIEGIRVTKKVKSSA